VTEIEYGKKIILLMLALFIGIFPHAEASPGSNQVDLFDVEQGKPIWATKNTEDIRMETLKWVRSINGFYEGDPSELNFKKGEYCLRIPTNRIRVKNKIMDTTIQDVFLNLGDDHEPFLLLFDVKWPARYFVLFGADVRSFLKELGIWKIVESKKYNFQ